jgi:hypothetical protein
VLRFLGVLRRGRTRHRRASAASTVLPASGAVGETEGTKLAVVPSSRGVAGPAGVSQKIALRNVRSHADLKAPVYFSTKFIAVDHELEAQDPFAGE